MFVLLNRKYSRHFNNDKIPPIDEKSLSYLKEYKFSELSNCFMLSTSNLISLLLMKFKFNSVENDFHPSLAQKKNL